MIELLKEYIEKYEIEKAIIIGRNIVNKNPNNQESIGFFVEFLLDLAESLPVLEERKEFLDQAKIVLAYVEENADLTPEYLEWLVAMSEKTLEVEKKITDAEDVKINKIVSDIEIENNKALMRIHNLCENLKLVDNQEDFDDIMVQFINNDRLIEKEYLTVEDQKQYDDLSKLCSDLIASKMKELEHKRDIEYNQKALDDFYDAYIDFSVNESMYKSNLNQLLSTLRYKLFVYESERLFPETAVYYQFVYSKIFEKLSDDGKMQLTKASIEASK